MNIAIDWGNSAIKAGFFENGELIEGYPHLSIEDLQQRVREQPPDAVVISSTSRPAEQLREQLPLKPETYWLTVTGYTPLPMEKRYDTPNTLGTDRIAAAVGAKVRFPDDDCLVIDMGTCITYDYVDADFVFHGGMISPGFRMRFRAMHSFTERLPLVEPEEPRPTLFGKNTRQAMQAGVINGLRAELNGIMDAHRREHPNVKVLICGGDAPFFESSLKPPIFVVPELVLIGLNRILQHNVYLS
ncbi:type III pantothenate kinase [Larkinella insperata]|uniref:Type III pantothenate kinase n=1 Tax=Larkinella insperata TaxID=332158 RepID=A0ABW3QG34_9BACT|nr:type III pantothenate kinase [Larkinella insperata]